MRPPKKNTTDFERIKLYDEWVPGIIEDVKLEENRNTGFKDDETGEPKFADMVRFKFKLDGHKYPHYSRWMSYTFGEKSNLFLKYLSKLVAGAQPDMVFDLDELKGFPIKTMWAANGEYDNLEQIRPLKDKLVSTGKQPQAAQDDAADEVGGYDEPPTE
jgi:hypothetical protein